MCRGRTLFFLVALLWSMAATPSAGQVAVIAHPSVPEETISSDDLLDLYALEVRRWSNGHPVVVLDLEQKGQVRDAFYAFLGKSPARMKSVWLVYKLSGEGDPPDSASDEAAMVSRVAQTPGAIGFVGLPVASDAVKVLRVIRAP